MNYFYDSELAAKVTSTAQWLLFVLDGVNDTFENDILTNRSDMDNND